jgi:predicted dehydrogenase
VGHGGVRQVPEVTVRVGVLGCASFARRRMLPAMAVAPRIEIAAIASRTAEAAAALAGQYGCVPVHGYAALLDRHDLDIDAVYIPLPAALHAEWVEAALRAGKHVLAEKPLSLDAATTRRLLALADERGLALMENVLFVHHAQHKAVRDLVQRGEIGEPRSFRAAFAVPRRPQHDIRLDPALGGGALWDVGVYPVRAALHFQDLLGGTLSVVGATLNGAGAAVETAGEALLRSTGAVGAHASFGLDHAYEASYTIHGSEAAVTVGRAFTPGADEAPAVTLGGKRLPLPPDDQITKMFDAFTAAVEAKRANRTAPAGEGPSSCNDGVLRQAELLDAIRAAAGRGTPDQDAA